MYRIEGEEALEYTKKYHNEGIRDHMKKEFGEDIIKHALRLHEGLISPKTFKAILRGYKEVAIEYICDSIDIEADIDAAKGDARYDAAKDEGRV